MADLKTVIWKEWREIVHSGSLRSLAGSMAVTFLLLGVIWPLQSSEAWFDGGALVLWTVGPLLQLPQLIADAFAGERERRTLETLLASRVGDRALLFGKILAPTLWAWGFVQASMLAALIPVNLAAHSLRFYDPLQLLSGMILSALAALLISSAGVLFSLRAASVRQAQQWMGILMIGFFFLPIGLIGLMKIMPDVARQAIEAWLLAGDSYLVILVAALFLALLDGLLLWAASLRFRRSRLILD